jgi:hypothetical protein
VKKLPALLLVLTVASTVTGATAAACAVRSPADSDPMSVAGPMNLGVPVPYVPLPLPPAGSLPNVEGPAAVGSPELIPAVVASPETPPAGASTQSLGPAAAPQLGSPGTNPADPFGPAPAPLLDPRRFTEAHWQGLEVVPKTQALAQALGIPPEVVGVIVDDVTLPADLDGFQAGDVVVGVAQVPTADLMAFIEATARVRDRRRAEVQVWRKAGLEVLVLNALLTRLGTANGETPSMIPSGSRMPHRYRGPCTNCHRIGTTGQLAVDPGDLTTTTAPTIRLGATRPHRDFGPCTACHQVQP